MNIGLTLVALVIVALGIFWREPPSPTQPEAGLPANTPSPSALPTTPTPPPTLIPSPPVTPTPTKLPKTLQYDNFWQDFTYPGAQVVSQNESSLNLTSSVDPETVTEWYKNRIQERGFTTKSFVQTKTNNNIHNVLVGADGSQEIRVELTRPNESADLRIVITRRTY